MKRKKVFAGLILLVFLFTLLALVFTIGENQETRKGAAGGVGFVFHPEETLLSAGGEVETNLSLNSGGKKISGVNLLVKYDPRVFELTGFTPFVGSLGPFSDDFSSRKEGEVRLVLFSDKSDSELPVGAIPLAVFKFKGKNPGQTEVRIDPNYEIIGFSGRQENYSITTDGLSLAVFQVGELMEDEPRKVLDSSFNLSFKTTFYGINSKITDLPIEVKAVRGEIEKKTTAKVTFSDNGVASGEINVPVIPEDEGYRIFIRGPRHLWQEYCQKEQRGACKEGEAITDLAGVFDWTRWPVWPGDLPDEKGERNGVIDAADFARLRAKVGATGANLSADLDFNGVVNGRDVAVFLKSMGEN